MKTLTCDVCRNIIESPVSNRNYFHLAHRDICEPCHDKLQALIKPTIRTKAPFTYEWYTKLVQESIEKAIQKGKFDAARA
ncbi:hypothetical protein FACS189447_02220 [Spirochaetia bacterium]|nr:hypothetical protein FACS189447_02220 [Spirochaetia bacterium]